MGDSNKVSTKAGSSGLNLDFAVPLEILSPTERRIVMIGVQIVAGVLAVCVLGIIVYRRKQKAV